MPTRVISARGMMVTKGAGLKRGLWEVGDSRKPSSATPHYFEEMAVIAMEAALSDCDSIDDIA